MATLSSPCIKLCVIDPGSGLCLGCGRTLAEITAWSAMAEAERRAVMGRLPARLAADTPLDLAALRIADPFPA